ncbi:MAG: Arc family DNA-binding protein [Bacillota bacterium]
MVKTKLQNIAPFGLRLQPDLKATLEREARKIPRSLNAEIAHRLEQSLVTHKELADYSDGELIDELLRRYGRDQVFIQLGRKTES